MTVSIFKSFGGITLKLFRSFKPAPREVSMMGILELAPDEFDAFEKACREPSQPTEANIRGAKMLKELGRQQREADERNRCRWCGGLRSHTARCIKARIDSGELWKEPRP